MKNLFNRTLSVLCAVILLISVVSAWAAAEDEAATPTDLTPAEEETIVDPAEKEIIPEEPGEEPQVEPEQAPEQQPEAEPVQEPETEPEQEPEAEPVQEPAEEPEEENIGSVEVVITKTLTVGQNWEGKMKKTKPAILKLDVAWPGMVYMLVEGKDVWATVEKSDRLAENPERTQTDPETDRMVVSWSAEEGSYLITLGPVEPNLLAAATVTFMSKSAYDAWEEEQAEEEPEPEEEPETEPEEEPEEKTEEEPEEKPEEPETVNESEKEIKPEEPDEEPSAETEQAENDDPEENRPESEIAPQRDITIDIIHDSPHPVIGDTAHFRTTLHGYEDLHYSIQWQYSPDNETWTDIPGANDLDMDVVVTPENNLYYWRIMIYVEEDQET